MNLSAASTLLFAASASAFAPATTPRTSSSSSSSALSQTTNQDPFGAGKSLEYTGGNDPNSKNYSKLSEKLQEADTERRKIQEEAERRERAAEIRREERLAKIKYMNDMPEDQPAGTVDEFMFKEGA